MGAGGLRLAAALGAVATTMTCAAAGAAAAPLHATLDFTSQTPGTPTGAVLNLVRPDGPDGKPKAEAVGVFQLAEGTTIDERAVPACTKDDTTLQVEGPDACPDSRIGQGFATLMTGLGSPVDPLTLDATWYHAPGEIVALFTPDGFDRPVVKVVHVQIKGATFVAPLDLPPGYPPGTKTVPKESDVTIDRHGSFITTPPSCPANGRWVSTVTLTYDDGTTDRARDTTPCKP